MIFGLLVLHKLFSAERDMMMTLYDDVRRIEEGSSRIFASTKKGQGKFHLRMVISRAGIEGKRG
jgi:hypothetical protein